MKKRIYYIDFFASSLSGSVRTEDTIDSQDRGSANSIDTINISGQYVPVISDIK